MSKRHAGIDLLRIVSVFLVLILHTLGQGGVLPTDLAARLTELAGREEGAERAVAMQLRKGLVTREAACLTLGVSDSDLDAVLEKYQEAR